MSKTLEKNRRTYDKTGHSKLCLSLSGTVNGNNDVYAFLELVTFNERIRDFEPKKEIDQLNKPLISRYFHDNIQTIIDFFLVQIQ